MPEVNPGMALTMAGEWVEHPRYGVQFQVEECQIALKRTEETSMI